MNSYPNSDCKQCTESKLGWVHCAHTQNPGRAHTARTVPRSWALLRAHCPRSAQVVGAAARTASRSRACRAHSQHRSCAQAACTQVATSLRCRDTKAARIMSRHQIGVATPPRPLHVTTSNRCRDIVSPAQPKPGRDIKTRSRPSWRRTYVATSISCRDLVSAHNGISRSRPPLQPLMSRHQIHVATPFLPNKST